MDVLCSTTVVAAALGPHQKPETDHGACTGDLVRLGAAEPVENETYTSAIEDVDFRGPRSVNISASNPDRRAIKEQSILFVFNMYAEDSFLPQNPISSWKLPTKLGGIQITNVGSPQQKVSAHAVCTVATELGKSL